MGFSMAMNEEQSSNGQAGSSPEVPMGNGTNVNADGPNDNDGNVSVTAEPSDVVTDTVEVMTQTVQSPAGMTNHVGQGATVDNHAPVLGNAANPYPVNGMAGDAFRTSVIPMQGMAGGPVVPPSSNVPPSVPPVYGGGDNGGTRHKGMPSWVKCLITGVVTSAVTLGIGFGAISAGWVTIPGDAVTTGISSIGSVGKNKGDLGSKTGSVDSWAQVAAKVAPSVVSIDSQSGTGASTGSGAVIDAQGHIVTNNHVVDGAKKVTVTMSDGRIIDADVIGTDPATDLAVVKLKTVPKTGLTPIEFADSNDLVVGQGVMSIGSPLGYSNTVTTGVISATNRPVVIATDGASNGVSATDAIQIDAAINPGNSGGPTFDSSGKAIGINSSIASTATDTSEAGNVGISFAIPSNVVKTITSSIIKDGRAHHAWLGVVMGGRDAQVTVDDVTRSGAQLLTVTDGSPADKAGLKKGDVIIAWDGEPLEGSDSVMSRVRGASIGDETTLTIVRDGKTMDVKVAFTQESPDSTPSNDKDSKSKDNGDNDDQQALQEELNDLLERFGLTR